MKDKKMLLTQLKELQLQSELISVNRSCHDEELTGIVCGADDNITSMHLYDNDGVYDGFTIFETYQVEEIFWGNREHKAISYLIEDKKKLYTPKLESKEFKEAIIELNSHFSSISFYASNDEDNFHMGKIESHDGTWLKINTFAIKNSLSPMKRLMQWESISRVDVNSPYQNKIVDLHKTEL
ncbi:MAG: hypothetical protein KUG81_04970 [Gammaproteobacteria bacterium]|nr:hypothetical protein [Gammaproteobacteria bacterium]